MKKILDFLTAKPARFFFLAALIWGGLMCFLNYKDGPSFHWHDLLVEANGMVFDLLVFGVLLSSYEALREKKDKIERLREEIEDYRGWDEKEAMYRIVGAVKRLSKLKVTEIDLSFCFLSKARFTNANLTNTQFIRAHLNSARFNGAILIRANLSEADLIETDLSNANLSDACLYAAQLTGASAFWANFSNADLSKTDFTGALLNKATLSGAILKGATLVGAALEGAKTESDWFEKLELWEVIGREEIKEKYLIDDDKKLRRKVSD